MKLFDDTPWFGRYAAFVAFNLHGWLYLRSLYRNIPTSFIRPVLTIAFLFYIFKARTHLVTLITTVNKDGNEGFSKVEYFFPSGCKIPRKIMYHG